MASKEEIEATYGREVILADRDMVEQERFNEIFHIYVFLKSTFSDVLLKNADSEDVCFLVVGDVFGATTHSDLVIRCKEDNIPYKVIHNASIMTAIGACGLQVQIAIYFFRRIIMTKISSFIILEKRYLSVFGMVIGSRIATMIKSGKIALWVFILYVC